MKKFIVLALLLCSVAPLFAQGRGRGPELPVQANVSFYEGGDSIIGIRGGGNIHYFSAIASYEIIGGKFINSEYFPAVWGISARGMFGSYRPYIGFGAGAYATARFGIRNTPIPPLNACEVYLGLGAKWDNLGVYYDGGIGFSAFSGFKYKWSDTMGAIVDYSYWGGNYGMVGIEWQF